MSRFGSLTGGKQQPKIERGYVKWFNEEDGFGEINTEKSTQTVFFDVTDTYLRPYMIPAPNEELIYERVLCESNSRPYAVNVRGPNNTEVGTQKSKINYKNYSITQRCFQTQRPTMRTLNNTNRNPNSGFNNNNRGPPRNLSQSNQNSTPYNRSNSNNNRQYLNTNGNYSQQRGGGQFKDIPNTGQSSGRKTGRCKWFNSEKGFGFIEMDDGTGDIFVHQTALKCHGFRSLALEEIVEFDIQMQENNKRKAINVTGPNGAFLKGAPPPMFNRDHDDIAG